MGRRTSNRAGFSLVELLVVMAIIGILLGVIWRGGGALIESGKARDTEAMMNTLTQAIETYKADVSQSRIAYADNVFIGGVPPDDLYVFAFEPSASQPGSTQADCRSPSGVLQSISLVQGTPAISVLTSLVDQRNQSTGALNSLGLDSRPFADVRAMVLAMRLRSPKASAILDRVDSRFVKSDGAMFDPNDGSAATPLVYYVDAWGTPIEYFATCKCSSSTLTPRVEASNAFIHANNSEPLLVSYGPNGQEQFSADFFADVGDTSVVADFTPDGLVNLPLNQDNIYSSTVFVDRLGGG